MDLYGTSVISSVPVFTPRFLPAKVEIFKVKMTINIVPTIQDQLSVVKRFITFQNFEASIGYWVYILFSPQVTVKQFATLNLA